MDAWRATCRDRACQIEHRSDKNIEKYAHYDDDVAHVITIYRRCRNKWGAVLLGGECVRSRDALPAAMSSTVGAGHRARARAIGGHACISGR